MDSTYVKTQPQSAGAKNGFKLGNPTSFLLSADQIHNGKIAISLLGTINIYGSCFIADQHMVQKKFLNTLYSIVPPT